MTQGFVFSWAENAEGKMVHVDDVPRGLNCGCVWFAITSFVNDWQWGERKNSTCFREYHMLEHPSILDE